MECESTLNILNEIKEKHSDNPAYTEALDVAIELLNKEAKNTYTRNLEIYYNRKYGYSYTELGRRYGLSKGRIEQICKAMQRKENAEGSDFADMTERTRNCLLRAGITTNLELHEFIDKNGEDGLYKVRNCGAKTLAEIMTHFRSTFYERSE